MSAIMTKGNLFPEEVVSELFNKVRGASALAAMSGQTPIPFNGTDVFTFSLDKEIDIVAESGEKTVGGITVEPVKIVPIKVEYGARVTDEFMYASEEKKLEILNAFSEGFARKIAKGFDIMAMHGHNPRTGSASAVIGTNHLDAKAATTVSYATDGASSADATVEAAVAGLDAKDYEASGLVIAPAFRTLLAAETANGTRLHPELGWGANPGAVNGMPVQVNGTVGKVATDYGYLGDFANAFKWGFAKQIPLEVIPYGDPDNIGKDLKGYNQVYLRAEAYIGWGVLDGDAFVKITT